MTRIVGQQHRSEFILDPVQALRRGRTLDVRVLTVDGVEVRTLDINGLLKTKTDYRDKDRIVREALERLKKQL